MKFDVEQAEAELEKLQKRLLARVERIRTAIERDEFDLARGESSVLEAECSSANLLANRLADAS